MRKELIKYKDQKLRISGTIERYGLKKQYIGGATPTILLKDVKIGDSNTDHLWVNVGSTLASLDIKEGSEIEFNAWVKGYDKGYVNRREDYSYLERDLGINRLSKIKILKSNEDGISFKKFWSSKRSSNFLSNKYDEIINS